MMPKIHITSFLLFLFCAGCSGKTQTVTMYSQPVVEAFIPAQRLEQLQKKNQSLSSLFSFSVPLGAEASAIAHARNVPVKVVSYGSGEGISITVCLEKGAETAGRADLMRTAMSVAASFCRLAWKSREESNRDIIAEVIIGNGVSADYDVKLAEAVFSPDSADPEDCAFPGPAWKKAVAAERVPNDLELRYLRGALSRWDDWGLSYKDWGDGRRNELTREQDVELSKTLDIAPGTVKVTPFILRPLEGMATKK